MTPLVAGGRIKTRVHTYEEFKATTRFAGLDGLRAVSIGLVLLHHLPRLPSGYLRSLQENGRYGVSLFFVISGFLISSLLLREREKFGQVSFKRFFARRALRLFPLYYGMLGLVMAAVYFAPVFTPESVAIMHKNLPAYLLYFSNWLPNPTEGPFFFSWSLAAEEQFYTVFGLMMVVASRGAVLRGVGLLLLFKGIATVVIGSVERQEGIWRILLSCQEPILWGVLLGFALNSRSGYERIAHLARSLPAISLVLMLCLAWMFTGPVRAIAAAEEQLLFPAFTLFVASTVTRSAIPFLDSPFCCHIGKISYGMYLIHWFVIVAVQRALPAGTPLPLFYAVVAFTTIAIATVVSVCFEQPVIRFGRRRFGDTGHKQSKRVLAEAEIDREVKPAGASG